MASAGAHIPNINSHHRLLLTVSCPHLVPSTPPSILTSGIRLEHAHLRLQGFGEIWPFPLYHPSLARLLIVSLLASSQSCNAPKFRTPTSILLHTLSTSYLEINHLFSTHKRPPDLSKAPAVPSSTFRHPSPDSRRTLQIGSFGPLKRRPGRHHTPKQQSKLHCLTSWTSSNRIFDHIDSICEYSNIYLESSKVL